MNIAAFFFLLAVLILIAMYLYAPWIRRERRLPVDEHHEISALMAERDRIINSLQELDFDFKLGKIPAGEYPAQRAVLLEKGAGILRTLDELAPPETNRGDSQSRMEKAVAARGLDAAGDSEQLSEDDLESLIAARRKERREKSAGFCPRCGKPVMESDRFCPACGKSLT